jgi:predicted HTH transcriptional regulator
MNVFSKPFHEVTFKDVTEFCAQKYPESITLDYKQAIPKDLAKHFATFSNTLGGVIIVGVEEDPQTGLPLKWEGMPNEGKLIERINQFATNVRPLPTYDVRMTDEVNGKVFVLINILEGDNPSYHANGDPTVWLRTGNISTPLRQPDREERERMVKKKARMASLS